MADFFSEFAPASKQQWLDQIAKDLKGKSLEDLYWHIGGEITLDPFAHADDFPEPPGPLQEAPLNWEINEDIEVADPGAANRQALEALSLGAESLSFTLPHQHGDILPDQLLSGIYLDHIGLQFGGQAVNDGPAAVLAILGRAAKGQGLRTSDLRGALYYDPETAPGNVRDWRYLIELLQYAGAEFPGFRCITVDGARGYSGAHEVVHELAALLQSGETYLENLSDRGFPAADTAAQIQFSVVVGKSYFVEMAKLRAFKLLWANVLNAWGVPAAYPVLDVRFYTGDYTGELYSNMIRATTMTMSAVLGGANRVTVLPYDAGRESQATYPRAFARRIARNVQHLLKMESYFGEITDPVAGSFYVEKLTAQFARAAWEKFRQR